MALPNPYFGQQTENYELCIDWPSKSFLEICSLYDHLILATIDGNRFEGDFLNGGRDRIDLVNVRGHMNSNLLNGVRSFYRHEIIEILKLKKEPIHKPIADLVKNVPTHQNISDDEWYRLNLVSRNFLYVEVKNGLFYRAVRELQEVSSIGVVLLGIDHNNVPPVGILVLSTWNHVYLFDMIKSNAGILFPELSSIFETEAVCKVFHRGRPAINILNQVFNIFVRNVFDSEVMDLVIATNTASHSSGVSRNISQCLIAYTNFRPAILEDALRTENDNWFFRPLIDRKKLCAAQLSTYLLVLRDVMRYMLFGTVNSTTDDICNRYCSLDGYNFARTCLATTSSHEVDKLVPICAGLYVEDPTSKISKTEDNREPVPVLKNTFSSNGANIQDRRAHLIRKHKRKCCYLRSVAKMERQAWEAKHFPKNENGEEDKNPTHLELEQSSMEVLNGASAIF